MKIIQSSYNILEIMNELRKNAIKELNQRNRGKQKFKYRHHYWLKKHYILLNEKSELKTYWKCEKEGEMIIKVSKIHSLEKLNEWFK